MTHSRPIMLALVAVACGAIWAVSRDGAPATDDLLSEARAALQAGHFQVAEHTAARALAASADSPDALLIAGEAAGKLGRNEQAFAYLSRIDDDHIAESVTARSLEGELYRHLGDAAAAERQFRKALALRPEAVFARHRLAYLLSLEGRSWESGPHFLELLRHEKCSREDLVLIAGLFLSVGESEELERFRRMRPLDPAPLVGMARRAERKNKLEEAEQLLRRAIELDPAFVEAHAWLGSVLARTANVSGLAAWNAALPPGAEEHPQVWQARGYWAKDRGQPTGAIRCFWETLRRDPNSKAANSQLAALLTSHESPESAAPFARRAEQLLQLELAIEGASFNTENGDAAHKAAQLLTELGRIWEAHGWYRWLIETHPEFASAEQDDQRCVALLRASPPLTLDSKNPARQMDLSQYPLPDWGRLAKVHDPSTTDGEESTVQFREMASALGIDFRNYPGTDPSTDGVRFLELTGGGVGALDYDGDAWPDLYFTQGCAWPPIAGQTEHLDRFYRNVAGQFHDVTQLAGLGDERFSQGLGAGDWNNDGFTDVFLANHGVNRLYRNNGDGTFDDVTEGAGTGGERWTTSCAIADLNGDGFADLYEVNYVEGETDRICSEGGHRTRCLPDWFLPQHDRLFLSRGDGRFEDVSETAGILAPEGNGLGIVAADFDGSGRISLFIANDRTANFYFTPPPNATSPSLNYAELALVRGVAVDRDGRAQGCMGVAADDVTGDGLLDLFVTNFYMESNTLYVQSPPGGSFVDRTIEAGLRDPSFYMLGFGAQFIDGELDGWSDLIVTNGHIEDLRPAGEPYKMRPQFFRNVGQGRFVEAPSTALGPFFQGEYLGRGMAIIDWDRDGREEVAISHIDEPAAVLHNETDQSGHYLALQLRGTISARDAIGATVRVRAGNRDRIRQLTAGSGYQASNQLQLVFGIGTVDRIEEVSVRWPSGTEQSFTDLTADGQFLLIEGDARGHRVAAPE